MANFSCSACDDLRNTSTDFVVNGIGSSECTSLGNNTGLNPSSGHDDCTDLNNINDCLVGNMAEEVEAYDVCDWKTFMKKFIPNVWTTFKAIICAICGLWKNFEKVWCYIQHMSQNTGGVLHAYVDDDPSKPTLNGFRIASGVQARTGSNSAPMIISVIGSTARITGSLTFSGNMPSSYTGGASVAWTDFDSYNSDVTNTVGNSSYKGNAPTGGFFVYEYQVNPCDYGFKNLYNANLMQGEASRFVFRVSTYQKGDEYPYDYGWDANGNGQIYNPSDPNKVLIQVRLINVDTWGIARNTGKVTPNGITMAVPCTSSWEC